MLFKSVQIGVNTLLAAQDSVIPAQLHHFSHYMTLGKSILLSGFQAHVHTIGGWPK